MNFKHFVLVFCMLIWSLTGYSQRNPDNEILVFFSDGVSQKIETVKGTPVKKMDFSNAKLKQSLNAAGIPDSLMEFALPNFKREDTLKILSDGQQLYQPDMSKLIRIRVPKGNDRKDLIKYLNSLPEVLYAEPNGSVKPFVAPNDTRYQNNEQWGLKNPTYPGRDIHAEGAWDIYTGNPNNIIAIVDWGVQTHQDLNDKIAGGDTGYGDSHGTSVSGIAAAESNNAQGISGVDWNARIHPQRVDNMDDADTYQAIIDAVNYSPNVHVLNHSWGLGDSDDPGRYSTTVRQAFAYAYKSNRTSVASMGNWQLDYPGVVVYPAGFENVIAVGATSKTDVIAYYSVQNNCIDVSAPGVNILSTRDGYYYSFGGTSAAAPFVSGVASLLKGYNPNLANDDIEHIIQLSADKTQRMDGQDYTIAYGYGRLNAERALQFLQEPYALRQWSASSGSTYYTTNYYEMSIIGVPTLNSDSYTVRRSEVRKHVTFPEEFQEIIGVWGRGVSSNGWRMADTNFGEGFCEVVPGTLTATGVTLRTYVYRVYSSEDLQIIGYFPTTAANATFAYTVLGILAPPPPTLSAPDLICYSGSTVSVQNVPSGATVTWGGTNVSYPSGSTGTSVTVRAISSTNSYNGTITATVSVGGTSSTLSKAVWVGPPKVTGISGDMSVPTFQNTRYYPIYEGVKSSPTDYEWYVNPDNGVTYNNYGLSTLVNFSNIGYYQIICSALNTCGWGNYYFSDFINVYGSYSLMISPNPSSGETTISIETGESGDISAMGTDETVFDETTEWELEVFDNVQSLKEKKIKLKGKNASINTQNWKEGVYLVRARYKDEILTGKLVVNQ